MPSLDRIKERTKTVTIDIGEEGKTDNLTVTIRPDRFTPADIAAMQERAQQEEQGGNVNEAMQDFCNFMCDLLVSWDLRWTTDGDIVPIEPDVIRDSLPFGFLYEIVEKTGVALQVGKPRR